MQIRATFPEGLVERMDAAATWRKQSRAHLLREAVEAYLEDLEDLRLGTLRLQDSSDAVLDWEDVKRDLFDQDQSERGEDPLEAS